MSPTPALAETCDKIRPDWDGGSVSAWAEAIQLFGTPISLFLIISTALVLRFRSSWGALAVFVGWSFAVATVTFWDPTGGMRQAAQIEGCIGTPTLYITIVFIICGAMMLYINRLQEKPKDP
ncbi:MAG: hypothetical protein AAGF55_13765 [Pseudomonadota bacterium]